MSRSFPEEIPVDHVTAERLALASRANRHRVPMPTFRPYLQGESKGREWPRHENCFDRDNGLGAARGMMIGVVLGALCWVLMGAFVYSIVLI